MALIVETGEGLKDADAFMSVAAADSFHEARGNEEWAGLALDKKEQAIRRATFHLSNSYSWQGHPKKGRGQALAFPRSPLVDADGNSIKADEVPREIIHACAALALQEALEPGSLDPTSAPSSLVKREKVGAIEVEYDNRTVGPDRGRPIVTAARDAIAPFLAVTAGGGIFGRAVRV